MTTPDIIPDLPDQLKSIWISNGLPNTFLTNLKFRGNASTAIPSSFRLGLAAQISIGLAGLSTAYLHYLRTGITQAVTVDARHAVLAFHSEAWYTIDDALPAGSLWDNIAGLYRTKDNGWARIHTNFPHHRAGVLDVLGISETPTKRATKASVIAAVLKWDGQALEDECARRGLCVVKMRSLQEWQETGQAAALSSVPVVGIHKVGDAAKIELQQKAGGSTRPLSGIKALDLSRVLAGPVAGRALAAHGAQVLLITSPNLPSLPSLDVETSLGKRTTQLDLKSTTNGDRHKFENLVKDADVILQAYRPGGLEALGFGVEDVIKIKAKQSGNGNSQGVVYASLRAWGFEGPWSGRRGYDSLVQTATGFNADEEDAYLAFIKSQNQIGNEKDKDKESEWKPRPFPMQALDHASGYFLAFGINVALARRITEGGSYDVRVSLASVAQWIRSLGRLDPVIAFGPQTKPLPAKTWPLDKEIARLSVTWNERRRIDHPLVKEGSTMKEGSRNEGVEKKENGRRRKMTALRHATLLDVTPVREGVVIEDEEEGWGAPIRLDADLPVWI